MDELDIISKKNELHILILKTKQKIDEGNTSQSYLDTLKTLNNTLQMVNSMHDKLNEMNRLLKNEKYNTIKAYHKNAILKREVNILEDRLKNSDL